MYSLVYMISFCWGIFLDLFQLVSQDIRLCSVSAAGKSGCDAIENIHSIRNSLTRLMGTAETPFAHAVENTGIKLINGKVVLTHVHGKEYLKLGSKKLIYFFPIAISLFPQNCFSFSTSISYSSLPSSDSAYTIGASIPMIPFVVISK